MYIEWNIQNIDTEKYNDVYSNSESWMSVGNKGRIATSMDGVNWSILTLYEDDYHAIHNHNGTWIAVGENGRISTLRPKHSWISREHGTRSYNDIFYFNGLWVAVGDMGRISFSMDNGVNWYNNTVGNQNYNSVHCYNGLWVAVGTNGKISTSSNGNQWTQYDRGTTHSDVYCHNGFWVITGEGGYVVTSSNGSTWSTRSAGLLPLRSVHNFNGIWVAVGDYGQICRSVNGIEWTIKTEGHANYNSVFNANGIWVAVGDNGLISASRDGNMWETSKIGSNNYQSVHNSAGKWIIVGSNGSLLNADTVVNDMLLNINNVLRPPHQIWIKDNTEHKRVHSVYVNKQGTLQSVYQYISPLYHGEMDIIHNYQYADYLGEASFGTLLLNDEPRDFPTKPWVKSDGGNMFTFIANGDGIDVGINQDISKIAITNTSPDINQQMRWHKFYKKHDLAGGLGNGFDIRNPEALIGKAGSYIFICDRTVLYDISWSDLYMGGTNENWILKKPIMIDGISYTCRLVTGGNSTSSNNGPAHQLNEWDQLMVSIHESGIPIWTRNTAEVGSSIGGGTWAQEIWATDSAARTRRGSNSPSDIRLRNASDRHNVSGWRPVLIPSN